MPSQTIVSLAILKVNWDKRRQDYLENFVPIIAECIRLSRHDVISVSELRGQLESRFGLRFPHPAINTMLRRLRKRGYIKLEHNVYHRDTKKLASLDFREVQQSVVEMHDSLLKSMLEYCKQEFGLDWSTDEAENHLLSYLKENDLQIMSAVTTGTLIPDISVTTKTAKYYCAQYINHLSNTSAAELDYLEKIVEGNMLANAIFLPDPARAHQKFHNTKLFFDTSFLIFALGYAGLPRQEPCLELMQMLYETGAELCCFSHTVDEIRGILSACAQRISDGMLTDPYGSIEYFIEKKYSESDIELLSANLAKDLASIRIREEDKPPYVPEYVIDEEGLSQALEQAIHYLRPQARNRDVDSISAIMRLRKIQDYYIIENCPALFTTTNSALARAATAFFYRQHQKNVVAPCITDHTLTNLLWLKKPFEMPNLPRKRIIADCYAALQPDENLVRAYLDEIKKLEEGKEITTDDVFTLRYSLEAKQALMDLTSGDEQVLTAATVKEIIELSKERIQAKIRIEIEKDAQAKISKATEERDEFEAQLDSDRKRLGEAQREIQELKTAEIIRTSNIKSRSQSIAHWCARLFKAVLIFIIVAGIVFTLPWQFPQIIEAPTRYFIAIILFFALLLVIFNLIKGVTIDSIARRIEVLLQKWLEKSIKKFTA